MLKDGVSVVHVVVEGRGITLTLQRERVGRGGILNRRLVVE